MTSRPASVRCLALLDSKRQSWLLVLFLSAISHSSPPNLHSTGYAAAIYGDKANLSGGRRKLDSCHCLRTVLRGGAPGCKDERDGDFSKAEIIPSIGGVLTQQLPSLPPALPPLPSLHYPRPPIPPPSSTTSQSSSASTHHFSLTAPQPAPRPLSPSTRVGFGGRYELQERVSVTRAKHPPSLITTLLQKGPALTEVPAGVVAEGERQLAIKAASAEAALQAVAHQLQAVTATAKREGGRGGEGEEEALQAVAQQLQAVTGTAQRAGRRGGEGEEEALLRYCALLSELGVLSELRGLLPLAFYYHRTAAVAAYEGRRELKRTRERGRGEGRRREREGGREGEGEREGERGDSAGEGERTLELLAAASLGHVGRLYLLAADLPGAVEALSSQVGLAEEAEEREMALHAKSLLQAVQRSLGYDESQQAVPAIKGAASPPPGKFRRADLPPPPSNSTPPSNHWLIQAAAPRSPDLLSYSALSAVTTEVQQRLRSRSRSPSSHPDPAGVVCRREQSPGSEMVVSANRRHIGVVRDLLRMPTDLEISELRQYHSRSISPGSPNNLGEGGPKSSAEGMRALANWAGGEADLEASLGGGGAQISTTGTKCWTA